MRSLLRNEKGAALLEYALLAAGVSLMSTASVSIMGCKVGDMFGAVASVMPGAHADDNGPMTSSKIVETTNPATGSISVDTAAIATNSDTPRLGNNLGYDLSGLVLEAE